MRKLPLTALALLALLAIGCPPKVGHMNMTLAVGAKGKLNIDENCNPLDRKIVDLDEQKQWVAVAPGKTNIGCKKGTIFIKVANASSLRIHGPRTLGKGCTYNYILYGVGAEEKNLTVGNRSDVEWKLPPEISREQDNSAPDSVKLKGNALGSGEIEARWGEMSAKLAVTIDESPCP